MDLVLDLIYWVKLILLVVVLVLAVWGAARASGSRVLVPWRVATQVVLAVVAFALLTWLAGPTFGLVWAAVVGVLGLVGGYMLGRSERRWEEGGRTCVRRSGLVPWLWAVAVILAVLMLLFGSSYLFALSMLLLAFALGQVLGQAIGEMTGRRGQPAAA